MIVYITAAMVETGVPVDLLCPGNYLFGELITDVSFHWVTTAGAPPHYFPHRFNIAGLTDPETRVTGQNEKRQQ